MNSQLNPLLSLPLTSQEIEELKEPKELKDLKKLSPSRTVSQFASYLKHLAKFTSQLASKLKLLSDSEPSSRSVP